MIARSIWRIFFVLAVATTSCRALRAPNPQKLHTLARRAIHNNACESAYIIYERVLRESPSSRTYLLKALLLERMGQWDAARVAFRSGNKSYPDDGKLLQAWGLMESRTGHATLAMRLLKRCVAVDQTLAPVLRWQRFSSSAEGRACPVGECYTP